MVKYIAEGCFGTVWQCKSKKTGKMVAIKSVPKTTTNSLLLQTEIAAWRAMNHPNIVKLIDVVDKKDSILFISEFIDGEPLANLLLKRDGALTEAEAKQFFKQIVEAVAYCHQRGYAHGDLKLENVLITKDNQVKLIDFGLAQKIERKPSTRYSGTLYYAAPEIIRHRPFDTRLSDLWSLGVSLFVMLNYSVPFNGSTQEEIATNILNMNHCPFAAELTDASVDLVCDILVSEPEERLNLEGILKHPWMASGNKAKSAGLKNKLRKLFFKN